MSFHNKPKYQIPELTQSLKDHGLEHDKPSQLADSFRTGWMAGRSAVQAAQPETVSIKVLEIALDRLQYISDFFCDEAGGDDWHLKGVAIDALEEIQRVRASAPTPEPMSARQQADWRSFIEGMEVSVDVSTDEASAEHRYFGTVSEVMDHPEAKHGVILLVQNPEPNFVPLDLAPQQPEPMSAPTAEPVAYWFQKHNCFGQLVWDIAFSAPRDATQVVPLYATPPSAATPEPSDAATEEVIDYARAMVNFYRERGEFTPVMIENLGESLDDFDAIRATKGGKL